MKRFVSLFLSLLLLLGLAACGSSAPAPAPEEDGSAEAETAPADTASAGNVLTICFEVAENSDVDAASSASVLPDTGRGYTKAVADMIQAEVGGEQYFVETAQDYPGEYNALTEFALDEQKENARPEVVGAPEALAESDTVFVVMAWGVFAFVRRGFFDYLFLRTAFVFLDDSEPVVFFLLDYLAVMALLAGAAYWLRKPGKTER